MPPNKKLVYKKTPGVTFKSDRKFKPVYLTHKQRILAAIVEADRFGESQVLSDLSYNRPADCPYHGESCFLNMCELGDGIRSQKLKGGKLDVRRPGFDLSIPHVGTVEVKSVTASGTIHEPSRAQRDNANYFAFYNGDPDRHRSYQYSPNKSISIKPKHYFIIPNRPR